MYIETPHGAYRVLQILAQDDSVFSCLAVRKGCGKEEVCLMQEFREPAAARELGRCLAEPGKRENSRFGVFVKEGSLWIVSRRYEGMPFGEACRGTKIPAEKLRLWDGVLREIFFQDFPVYLQYEAASPSNLIVDSSLAVHANLLLSGPDVREAELFPEVQRRLAESFSKLFVRERGDKDGAAAAYEKRLREAEFADGRAVYQGFRELECALRRQTPQGNAAREKYLIRCWKKLFAHADGAVRYGYWLAVAALWGLFFAVCARPAAAPAGQTPVSEIGTVKIRGSEPPSEEIGTGSVPGTESSGETDTGTEEAPETEEDSGTEEAPETEADMGAETVPETEEDSEPKGAEMG